MHHKGFIEGIFIVAAFNMDQRSLRQRRQHFMRRLGFEDHFPRYAIAAHAAFPLINRVEVGVGHPGGIEVDRRHVKGLFNPGGVIQQPVIGGVGDHRMHRPLRATSCLYFVLDAIAGKFPFRNAAEDPQRVTRRF